MKISRRSFLKGSGGVIFGAATLATSGLPTLNPLELLSGGPEIITLSLLDNQGGYYAAPIPLNLAPDEAFEYKLLLEATRDFSFSGVHICNENYQTLFYANADQELRLKSGDTQEVLLNMTGEPHVIS